jgi:TonB family protein
MLMQEVIEHWRGQRRGIRLSLSLLCVPTLLTMTLLSSPVYGQTARDRTVITRVEPEYPATLKRLYIGGAVRVEVVVAPDGTVESTQLIGGNPILGQTAMRAIKQWKYDRAKAKETLIVKLEFDPHS